MTPEYKFNIEGLINKEKIVGGLMDSGYILSVKKRLNDLYEISIYGKERLDGKGSKPSDFFKEPVSSTGVINTPWVSATTDTHGSYTVNNHDPKFLVDADEIAKSINKVVTTSTFSR
jgi:hypothetical protein